MNTELIGQSQTVGEEAEDAAMVFTAQPTAEFAGRLGESVLRATGRVGVNLAWVEGWLRLGKKVDLAHCTDAELDREVKTVVRIIDHSSEGGSERLARTYGL